MMTDSLKSWKRINAMPRSSRGLTSATYVAVPAWIMPVATPMTALDSAQIFQLLETTSTTAPRRMPNMEASTTVRRPKKSAIKPPMYSPAN